MGENQKNDAHYTVYKITGPDGKVYIGQTGDTLKKRWSRGYHLAEKERRGAIGEAIAQFGKDQFTMEALCTNLTQEGAWALEAWFIDYYDSMNPEKGYNRKTGGRNTGCHLSEYSKERQFSPERRAKMSRRMKERSAEGKNDAFINCDHKPKPVICVETGVRYSSQREAERLTGLPKIHNVCHGHQLTTGGYHWRLVEEAEAMPETNKAEEA